MESYLFAVLLGVAVVIFVLVLVFVYQKTKIYCQANINGKVIQINQKGYFKLVLKIDNELIVKQKIKQHNSLECNIGGDAIKFVISFKAFGAHEIQLYVNGKERKDLISY